MLFLITLCLSIAIFMSIFLIFTQEKHFVFIGLLELTDSSSLKILRCLNCSVLYLFELVLIYLKVYNALGIKYPFFSIFVIVINVLYFLKRYVISQKILNKKQEDNYEKKSILDDESAVV